MEDTRYRYSGKLPVEIVDTIEGYEDKDFLITLYSYDGLRKWYHNGPDKLKSKYDGAQVNQLEIFIEENPITSTEKLRTIKYWPDLLLPFLEYITVTIKSVHAIQKFDRIGYGTFAFVYRGKCKIYNTQREVAIKKPTYGDDFISKKEKEIICQLNHLFIVEYLSDFTDPSADIVMELCDGNLHDCVKDRPDDPSLDRAVIGQVVVALSYLHGKDIIHKDLNPNNILFKSTNCQVPLIKLTDFGYSRQLRPGKNSFDVTDHRGTRGYKSPELLTTGKPSFASDVWALGAVTFFVISKGKSPYKFPQFTNAFTDEAIMMLRNPPNIGDIQDWSAADLIYRLLSYDPGRRPSIFHVLLHPFFSTVDESTKTYLAIKINNFYIYHKTDKVGKKFKECFDEGKLINWYNELDSKLKYEEDPHTIEILRKLIGEMKESSEVPTKVRETLGKELNLCRNINSIDFPFLNQIKSLLDSGINLFAYYLWDAVSSVTKNTEDEKKIFQVSELEYALFHCPVKFFDTARQNWGSEKGQLEGLLLLASLTPRCDIVDMLLREGANVNAVTEQQWTALHAAANNNSNAEVVRILIENGANVEARDEQQWTALHAAAHYNSNAEVVRILIENGANVNAVSEKQWTALHHAGCNSNENITKLLIDHGLFVNVLDVNNHSPLHVAARCNVNPKVVRLLLENGADVNATNAKGATPVDLAEQNPNRDDIFLEISLFKLISLK